MAQVIPKSDALKMALSGSLYLDVAAMPWIEPVPGLRMRFLYKDRDAKEAKVWVEA